MFQKQKIYFGSIIYLYAFIICYIFISIFTSRFCYQMIDYSIKSITKSQPNSTVYNLLTNHMSNPIGYNFRYITFSWKVNCSYGTRTKSALILISLDSNFSSIVYSDETEKVQSHSYHPKFIPQNQTRYYWKVIVTINNATQPPINSKTAFFETANPNFSASWIQSPQSQDESVTFSKEFNIPETFKDVWARAYISGLGIYECYINGKHVQNEYLTPGFHSYKFYVQYQTYDISEYLINGKNKIQFIVGNGWYRSKLKGIGGYHSNLWGDRFCVFGQFEIRSSLENEEKIIINTDTTWDVRSYQVQKNGIYFGEVFNSTLKTKIIGKAEQSTQKYLKKYPVPRISLPLTKHEIFIPQKVILTPKKETVIDYGQNFAGWVEFTNNLPINYTIRLQYTELLQDGNFYNKNLRDANQDFYYISNGKHEIIRPHFTYYGFRYIKITISDPISKKFKNPIQSNYFKSEKSIEDFSSNFIAYVIHSNLTQIGKIETSNQYVNRLFLNALWSQKSNFFDTATDCPQRDERLGWAGDAELFSGTACFNMDSSQFYEKYIYDIHQEQGELEGAVPSYIPLLPRISQEEIDNRNIFDTPEIGSSVWGDSVINIPWNLWIHYGDKSLLELNYESMCEWISYLLKRASRDKGFLLLSGFQYADWLSLEKFKKKCDPESGTNQHYVASAFFYRAALITSKAAQVLGKKEDAYKYSKLAENIKSEFENYFIKPKKKRYDRRLNTQTASVIAIQFDLGNITQNAVNLHNKLQRNKMHLETGLPGTAYLNRALTKCGLIKDSYDLLLNTDMPSWLYQVKMGATTIWERWNTLDKNGHIIDISLGSLNHYAWGSINEWIYRDVCGINPSEEDNKTGFRMVYLTPHPDPTERLKFAKATVDSPYGVYVSSWYIGEYKYNGRSIRGIYYDVVVPFDSAALLTLQGDERMLRILSGKDRIVSINEGKGRFSLLLNPGTFCLFVIGEN